MTKTDPGRQIILQLLSSRLGLPAEAIDASERFIHYGVDSIMAAQLSVELSAQIGRELPATALWEHPTVDALSAHLRMRELAPEQPRASEASHSPTIRPRPAHTAPGPQVAQGGVAIVGLACRFPAAPDARSFWRLLAEGGDAIRDVPADRWARRSVPAADAIHRAGLLDDVAGFDAAFFGISPREAAEMDPQQRLMLELSSEALVDAGIPAAELRGSRTGVFTGAMWRDYATLNRSGLDGVSNFTATGEDLSIVSGRVSYYFGFEGPSLTVNTACSSSLVAVHLACRSLLWGESSIALAGGVNLILDPRSSVAMARFGGLSQDGRCKAFDARADGYVRGEGGAVVVLKPLADAIADGDRIYCVIRGSAVNNDGFSNGLTAPNPRQQVAVLRDAWANAGIPMARAQYVEAHGTGTALGDPIEANALGEAFGPDRAAPLRIGSVKTNIGHLEAAAGVAGLIKTALSIHNRQLPPSLHYHEPNPRISFGALNVAVQTALEAWPGEGAALAGVSSFGFGGTNCHVVLEAADPFTEDAMDDAQAAGEADVFVLSAQSQTALARHVATTAEYLAGARDAFHDVCRTSTARRSPLRYRAALVASSVPEIVARLNGAAPGHLLMGQKPAAGPAPLAFVFNGQGSLSRGMLSDPITSDPGFQTIWRDCVRLVAALADWDLDAAAGEGRGIERTSVAQLTLFSIQASLLAALRSWGIAPAAVIGHSAGEVAAAYAAGVFDLEAAIGLLHHRGSLMERMHGQGGMLAVSEPESAVGDIIKSYPGLCVAAVNGPRATVVSGAIDGLALLARDLSARGVPHRRLDVAYAFHSEQMEEPSRSLEQALKAIAPAAPDCTVVSTVTGDVQAAGDFAPLYWRRNMRAPVLFEAGVKRLLALGIGNFVEIGASSVLAHAIASTAGRTPVWVGSTARDGRPAREAALTVAAKAYCEGVAVDWKNIHRAAGRPVDLPSPPFERQRLWLADKPSAPAASPEPAPVPAAYDDGVRQYYAALLARNGAGEFLRFGAFKAPREGFSWLRPWVDPSRYPEEYAIAAAAVGEVTSVLFKPFDMHRAHTVLDIGCGYATDLMTLAAAYPQLQLRGCNISPEQVAAGRRRVAESGLAVRIEIAEADSRYDDIPGRYDVVLSFQVAHHVREKDALFRNVGTRLASDGVWLFEEVLSRLDAGIAHEASSAWFVSPGEWAGLLAEQGLEVAYCIDASHEVANFLHDPLFDANYAEIAEAYDRNALDHLRGPANLARLLEKGLAMYGLIAVRRANGIAAGDLLQRNRARMTAPIAYATARDTRFEDWDGATALPVVAQGPRGGLAREQIRDIIAQLLHMPPERLESDRPLGEYGVDSMLALEIRQHLERASGRALSATLLYNYPTIDRLTEVLAAPASAPVAPPMPALPAPVAPMRQASMPSPSMPRSSASSPARPAHEPIAIIGIGCRMPGGAGDPAAFWRLLAAGTDAVADVPADRWDAAALHDADPAAAGKIVNRRGGFLAGVDQFEPEFFGIAPREAVRMDPQQRLALEVAWEALESAGQPAAALAGSRTGVWVGVMGNDYAQINYASEDRIDAYSYAGYSFIPNRISHALDLRGPSVAVDTACSSSLVAIHQACLSLRSGESDLAIAGGVNLILTPALSINYSKWGMLSKAGRCATFDAGADGFVRGEGCGMVVLKPLSAALRDGDFIWASIRGTAVGQDGRTNVFTAPSGLAQRRVMQAALADADSNPAEIGFVETHGTGTALGDPIEAEALAEIYGRQGDAPCYLGAVKTNLGHLEGAAGVTGLIKAALALHFATIPANLNFTALNPLISLAHTRLNLPQRTVPWMASSKARQAAVSSFGAGGTNAHAILEEAPRRGAPLPPPTGSRWRVLPFSARGPAALAAFVRRVREALPDDAGLDDFCWSLALRRTAYPDRLAIPFRTRDELLARLDAWLAHGAAHGLATATEDAADTAAGRLARAWAEGQDVDWSQLFPQPGNFRPAPLYPWQRARYWAEQAAPPVRRGVSRLPAAVPIWSVTLDTDAGHRLDGVEIAPAALWLDLLTDIGAELSGTGQGIEIRDLTLLAPVRAAPGDAVQIVFESIACPTGFRIYHCAAGQRDWVPCVQGRIDRTSLAADSVDARQWRQGLAPEQPFAAIHERFRRGGLVHSGAYALGRTIRREGSHAAAMVAVAAARPRAAWLDCCLQALAAIDGTSEALLVPAAIERCTLYGDPATAEIVALATLAASSPSEQSGDVRIIDGHGTVLVEIFGVRLRSAGLPERPATYIHRIAWTPVTAPLRPAGPAASWTLVHDGAAAALALAAGLREAGDAVQEVDVRTGFDVIKGSAVLFAVGLDAANSFAAAPLCGLLLRTLQAVAAAGVDRFDLITRAASPAGGERVDPCASALHGFARSAALEQPDIRFRLLDLPAAADDTQMATALAVLRSDAGGGERAYRDGEWRTPAITAARLQPARPSIDAHATYLVTGGLGALGRQVGDWLVARGARRLVLLTRTAHPEAAMDLARWREAGAEVEMVLGDVASLEAVRDAIGRAGAALRGVFHAAGLLDDGLLPGLTVERTERILAPKVEGARHLHALTQGLELDHFVMFSSIAAVPGSPGQCAYAAANAFLDGLVHMRRAAGLSGVSINWGPWAGAGMAQALSDASWRRWAGRGLRPLSPADAIAALEQVLASGEAQLIVADADFTPSATPAAPVVLPWTAIMAAGAPGARLEIVVERIAGMSAEVLGLRPGAQVKQSDRFFERGFDSLMALDLRNRLASEFGIPGLRSTVVFDYPTPLSLAQHLLASQAPSTPETAATGAAAQDASDDIAARLTSALAGWQAERDEQVRP